MNRITLFRTIPRIVMGPGALNQLADEVKAQKANKVLIVTDQGLIDAGLVGQAQAVLEKSDIKYAVFGDVEADPRYEIVSDCVEMIHREKSDLIIGFGGGSPIDIAKVSAIMATNEGPIMEYFGIDLVPKSGLPTIIIPTTAGTGSEVTPIAILSDHTEKLKKGIVSQYLFPSAALLDPELTLGLPAHVTAATGMDALIHAVESFTSKNATTISDMLGRQAMQLIAKNIRTAYADGSNLEARSNMLEAMRTLATDLKIPDHLSEFGIQDKDIPELAAGVMKVTRLLANNPRELTQKDAEAIYRSVL